MGSDQVVLQLQPLVREPLVVPHHRILKFVRRVEDEALSVVGAAALPAVGTESGPKHPLANVQQAVPAPPPEALWREHLRGVMKAKRQGTRFHPEEVAQPDRYFEGATRAVYVNVYERNRVARAAFVDHYHAVCQVCDVDFGERYGDIGEGFIHVHHLKPLSEIRRGYEVDAVRDLRPVCPNCHAMLHQQDPPLTIAQLRKMMRRP